MSNYYSHRVRSELMGWKLQRIPGYSTGVDGLAAVRHLVGERDNHQPEYDGKFVLLHVPSQLCLGPVGHGGPALYETTKLYLFDSREDAKRFAQGISGVTDWSKNLNDASIDVRLEVGEKVAAAWDAWNAPGTPAVVSNNTDPTPPSSSSNDVGSYGYPVPNYTEGGHDA